MFNQDLIKKRSARSVDYVYNSNFFRFTESDLLTRLELLQNDFSRILVINPKTEIFQSQIKKAYQKAEMKYIKSYDQIFLQQDNKFDLIIFGFGLHWVNEVSHFFNSARSLLNSDGIFICNFAAANSLTFLRKEIIALEAKFNNPHAPHISPFVRFEDISSLLKRSLFQESIVDFEELELEFDSVYDLMKALGRAGQSNALTNHVRYSITKGMLEYLQQSQLQSAEKDFIDKINLVTFIAAPNKSSIKL